MSAPAVVCKWCGRSREDEQPLEHLRGRFPNFLWRRKDGTECAICPMVIASDPALQKMAKRELDEKIMASEAHRKKFRSKVHVRRMHRVARVRHHSPARARASQRAKQACRRAAA